ncbi:DUF1836 domain-containing protein [Helicovermis profundi]|uniref:DUF1836 domain-containing protein n=1 Tax=Helicovermis profundi TaxID=3065157 RepID=A0AAU9EB81_9FIRM|nr:DUF1836 domain-containing protein [Clostridia bacterium S502]
MSRFNNFVGIKEKLIPNIPLYMDQVLIFFDEKLSVLKRKDDEKILTKTMINNYVKAKVIPKPIKKKYSKDQIMRLYLVYQLKNVLSIDDVKGFINILSDSDDENDPNNLSKYYNMFLEIEEKKYKEIEKKFQSNFESDDKKNREEMIELLIEFAVDSNIKKRVIEDILDR